MPPETIRELKLMIDNLSKDMEAGFNRNELGHTALMNKLVRTGKDVEKNTRWRWIQTGALAMITAVLLPIVFIVTGKL